MFDSSPIDQADEYGRNLLSRNQLSEVEKFNLLREFSICVAGNRADGKPRTSREEYENLMLGLYQERIDLDLHIYKGSIGANFTADIMKKRVLGVKARKLTQRMKDALVKAEVKAAKKNVASLDPDNFSALECVDLFLAIKYESNNTFNPIWVNALNKNGDIPSGAQLNDLLDKVREGAFALKESLRIKYLLQGRKRDAKKKSAVKRDIVKKFVAFLMERGVQTANGRTVYIPGKEGVSVPNNKRLEGKQPLTRAFEEKERNMRAILIEGNTNRGPALLP